LHELRLRRLRLRCVVHLLLLLLLHGLWCGRDGSLLRLAVRERGSVHCLRLRLMLERQGLLLLHRDQGRGQGVLGRCVGRRWLRLRLRLRLLLLHGYCVGGNWCRRQMRRRGCILMRWGSCRRGGGSVVDVMLFLLLLEL